MSGPGLAHARPDVSFLIPCLNEEETLGDCLDQIRRVCDAEGLHAEIVVADNGSADRSVSIAEAAGARVVHVHDRGYGACLLGGIEAAAAPVVVMLDADLSYDPAESAALLARVREGADLVIGSRLRGTIEPGAMPAAHRRLGTPTLTTFTRLLFGGDLSDTQSGMRAFRRDAVLGLGLSSSGMEFASEMIVRAFLAGLEVREVPIVFRRDGRTRPPHLRPWRDGWRHLRLLMLLSPRWTLAVPGLIALALGLLLGGLVVGGPLHLGGVTLDLHSLVVASLLIVIGYQAVATAVAIRFNPLVEHLGRTGPLLDRLASRMSVERGIGIGGAVFLAGAAVIGWQTAEWVARDLGPLPVERSLRTVIVGATLCAVGVQTLLTSVMCGMLALPPRRLSPPAVAPRTGS